VFSKYKDVKPLSKKKLNKRWRKHERDLETVSFMSQIDAKKALSMLLNASIVVAPLFIEDGKITRSKVDTLTGRARTYKDKLKKLSWKDAAAKVKNDVTERMDENLVSSGTRMGLNALGFGSDAAVLSTLAKQVITKGRKGIDPTELAEVQAKESSNIGYTLAQIAMRTLTGEKTKSDEMRKAERFIEAERAMRERDQE
jgi:hypothetical protein